MIIVLQSIQDGEICDGFDNNCDDETDEGLLIELLLDVDLGWISAMMVLSALGVLAGFAA